MSCKVDNTYVSALKNEAKDEELVIKVCKMPSYVSCFLMDDNEEARDIILGHKVMSGLDESFENDDSLLKENNESILSDVSGNPLEAPYNNDSLNSLSILSCKDTVFVPSAFKREEYTHAPVTIYKAVQLMNFSNLNLKPQIPIWFLTDATDHWHSVLLGSSINDGKWFTRYWASADNFDDSLSVDEMLKKHYKLCTSKDKVEVQVTCKICVSENRSTGDLSDSLGRVIMSASWDKLSYKIPPAGASISLELSVKAGDERSSVYLIWQQVLHLEACFNLLLQWKQEEATGPLLPQQRATLVLPTLAERLIERNNLPLSNRIVGILNSASLWNQDFKSSLDSFAELVAEIAKGNTPCMDITDKLWLLLIECSTYQELATHVALAFQEAKKATVKPFVSPQNMSKLGEGLRVVASDKSANPQLLMEPLQLLVEIGVEKLKRDYTSLFTQSGLVADGNLPTPISKSFVMMDEDSWVESVSGWLAWMGKVHAAAELACVVNSSVNVVSRTVNTVNQRLLGHYLGQSSPVSSVAHLRDNPSLRFVTPVNNFMATSSSQNPVYDKWLLRLTTKGENRCVSTSFLKSKNPLFPVSVKDNDNFHITINSSSIGSTQFTDKYFCAQLNSVSNKLNVL